MTYTKLTTPDNKKVTVPNGALSNSNIVNYSAKNIRRVDFTFSVGYESDIELVKKLLVKAAVTHPLVLKEPLPFVGLSTHGDSALAFTLRTWVNSGDYWTVYFDLNETVKAEFDAVGIQYTEEMIHKVAELRVKEEINRGVQMIQYQVITLMTTNGQSPFVTVFMYLNEARDEQEKALKETIIRVKTNSVEEATRLLDPTDIAGLQRLMEAKRNLQDLQKLHISID